MDNTPRHCCENCVFFRRSPSETPCVTCYDKDEFIKARKDNMTIKPYARTCDNCKHEDLLFAEAPCEECLYSEDDTRWEPKCTPGTSCEAQEGAKINDSVDHPGHYTRLPIEAIKAIKILVTEVYGEKGFEAHCFATELKYRLRAGFKGDPGEDIDKALKYEKFRNGDFS